MTQAMFMKKVKEDLKEVINDPAIRRTVISEAEELKKKRHGKYAQMSQAFERNKNTVGEHSKEWKLMNGAFKT